MSNDYTNKEQNQGNGNPLHGDVGKEDTNFNSTLKKLATKTLPKVSNNDVIKKKLLNLNFNPKTNKQRQPLVLNKKIISTLKHVPITNNSAGGGRNRKNVLRKKSLRKKSFQYKKKYGGKRKSKVLKKKK